jgi:archaellum biogenesis ATPase FlaH
MSDAPGNLPTPEEIARLLAESRQMRADAGFDDTSFEESDEVRAYYERIEEEHARTFHEPPKPNGHREPPKPEPLTGISAATLKGKQKPREFLDVSEIFPVRNVALFMGDGAIGKSLLILQLALACTTATQWLSVDVLQGPVVYLSAEDDRQEITNRLNEICDADGIDLDLAEGLTILDMVGQDTVLAVEDRNKRLQPTAVYHRLCVTLDLYRPALLIIDNLADVFSGNENNRTHAKQFITLLRGLCLKYDCIIILLGHPSLSGRDKGTGESGSTGWNNSVRVRPYFHKPDSADAGDDDRIFEVMKANYAKAGSIRWELKWKQGRFVKAEIQSAFDRITVSDVDRVKEKFAKGSWRVNEQSVDWGGYAVADVLGWDIGRGIAAKQRSKEQATNRANIRTYLGTWVRTKSIYVIDGFTAKRERTQFYSDRVGLSVVT